jgi:hypothetical protein
MSTKTFSVTDSHGSDHTIAADSYVIDEGYLHLLDSPNGAGPFAGDAQHVATFAPNLWVAVYEVVAK